MKQKTLVRALGLTLALAPLAGMAAVENINYFGYAKWGNIYTDNDEHNSGKGERNDVIRASQGYGNYRLGNELNWWEAGLKADVWQQGDAYFDTTLYLGSGESWGDVSLIQMWSAGHGLIDGQADTKVWAGERFYRRHEVHMIDIKYWDTSSTGIGLEDWDFGNVICRHDCAGYRVSAYSCFTEVFAFAPDAGDFVDFILIGGGLGHGAFFGGAF